MKSSKLCFLVLRQRLFSIQCVIELGSEIPAEMIHFAGSIPRESIVDVEGVLEIKVKNDDLIGKDTVFGKLHFKIRDIKTAPDGMVSGTWPLEVGLRSPRSSRGDAATLSLTLTYSANTHQITK